MDIKINKTWLNFSEKNPIEQPEIEQKKESKFDKINFNQQYDDLVSKEIKFQKKLDYINIDGIIEKKEIKKPEKKKNI